MSLRVRAALLLLGIEGGTMLLIIIASTGYLFRDGMGDIDRRAQETSAIVRVALAGPMYDRNEYLILATAHDVFSWIEDVDRIDVTDEGGEVLASFQRGHNLTSSDHIAVSSPIYLGETCFGLVDIVYSIEDAKRDAQSHVWALGSFAILGMACSGMVAWFTLSRWSEMISTVQQGICKIAEGDPPEEFVDYHKDDELGKLVYSYNKLINQMHRIPTWAT